MLVQGEEPRRRMINCLLQHHCTILWVNLCCCRRAVFTVWCESPFQAPSTWHFFFRHLKDFPASPRSVSTSIKDHVLYAVAPKQTNLQLNRYLKPPNSSSNRGHWNNSLVYLVFTHQIPGIPRNFPHTFPWRFMTFPNNPILVNSRDMLIEIQRFHMIITRYSELHYQRRWNRSLTFP